MMAVVALSDSLVAVIVVVALAGLAVTLWAIIDAASTPTSTFRDAGSSKALWIVLISVLYLLTVYPGIIMAIVYLSSIRRRLRRSQAHREPSPSTLP